MCEYFWEPLAEVHLSLAGRSSEEDIYCLCSRVLIRDGDDLAKGMCEKADGSEDDSTQYDEYDKTSMSPFRMNNVVSEHQTIKAVGKHDTEEAVSCYCSASHTDNNYSTDEHEHDSGVGVARSGLQLSDSGADLSECGGDFQCSSSSRNEDWERYWSVNGERIIWQSWIAKYGEYINPGYLEQQGEVVPFAQDKVTYDSLENKTDEDNVINEYQSSSQSQDSFENTHLNTFQSSVQESMSKDELNPSKNMTSLSVEESNVTTTSGNFLLDENAADTTYSESEYKKTEWQGSFDVMLPAIVKTDIKNKDEDLLTSPCGRTETKQDVLACNSDESNTSPTDMWSPLSPSSTDDSSGDGGAVAGSVANTAITSDSMTNVTKITVSSLDLSYGDMEDSVTSSSLSSSSASSGSATGTTDEADRYWHNLWKQHFNDQYYAHYNAFLTWEIKEVNIEADVIRHPLFQLGEEPESAKQDSFHEIEPSLGIASTSCNKSNTELNIVEDYYSSNDVLSHDDMESSKCKSCSSKVDDLKDSLKNLSCSCSLTLTEENVDNTKTLSIDEDFSSVGKMELSPGTEHSFEEFNHAKEELLSKMEKMCGEIRQHNISVDEDISGIGRMELSPGTDHSLEELDHERQHLNSVSSTDMLVEDREDTFADIGQETKYNGNSNALKKESHVPRTPKKISSKKRKSRLLLNSVGHLLKTLSMLDCQFEPVDSPNDAGGGKKTSGTPEKEEICKTGSSSNEQTHDTSSLGTRKDNDDGDEPPEERPITLKRSHESDSDESSLDRVKSAFTLMGLAFAPNKQCNSSLSSIPSIHRGSVFYRKRNIRDQNRQLKMNIYQRRTQKQQQIPVSNSASSVLDKAKQFFENEAQYAAEDAAIRAALCYDGHSSSDDEQLAPPSRNITCANREKRRLLLSTVVCASVEGDMDLAESDYEDMDQHEEQYSTPMENVVETEQEKKMPADEVSESTMKELELESITSVEVVPKEENEGEEVVVKRSQQKKKKKKNKKASLTSLPEEIVANKILRKYWIRRYQLFSKFDEGIKLDEESWFSSTPERVASHIAERCRCDLIIDAFCGAGSCTIQFAFTCSRVIAIDIDPEKIEIARHNADIYGVADRIEFLVGDFMSLAPTLRADVVFLSPPWGGPQYKNIDVYDIESIMEPIGGTRLFETSLRVTDNVAYYVPRNINTDELVMLSGPGGEVEIEQSFLDKRLVAVTAYYGELIHEEA